jgi:tetratricopeptide (TPR) repeat protein
MGGRPADAAVAIRRAMRSSPVYPTWYLNVLGFAHYLLGEHDAAADALSLALKRDPAYVDCLLILAASHHARGRMDDARSTIAEFRRHHPTYRLESFEKQLSVLKDKERKAEFFRVMRELGLE